MTGGFSIKNPTLQTASMRGSTEGRAYNPCMFHSLNTLLGTAVIERLNLLANHVIAAEPIAVERLRTHVGRSIELRFEGWPSVLPPLPLVAFRVTPAGLLEWCGETPPEAPDLRVVIDASNPALAMAQALAGTRPKIEIAGDAAFATDLNWLFDNLRWDVQDDLARIVGAGPAREIGRIGGGIASALRQAVAQVSGLVGRARRTDSSPPPR